MATTVPIRSEPLVGVLTNQTFPLTRVSGLDGFTAITSPVELRGRHWLIASRVSPGDRATVLSSEDGWEWIPEAEIVAPAGKAIKVDHLAAANDQLLAAGSSGEVIGKRYWPYFSGDLSVWNSADGQDWHVETLGTKVPNNAYWVQQLVASDSTTLLTGSAFHTPDPAILEFLPPELEPALVSGDLWLSPQPTELKIEAPLGIVVFSSSLASNLRWKFGPPSGFLYRRDEEKWVEGEPPSLGGFGEVGRIAVLPDGGFVSTSRMVKAFTSTGGVDWQPDSSLSNALEYLNWGQRVAARRSLTSYLIDDGAGFVEVNFPEEMIEEERHLTLTGVPGGLVAVEVTFGNAPPHRLEAGDYTLSDELGTLSVTSPAFAGRVYIPRDPSTPHGYDSVTGIVTMVAGDLTFEFPLADLQRFAEWTPAHHDLYVSTDGLNWSRALIDLVSDGVQILGGGTDFFLVSSFDHDVSGQGQSMTVYRAGLFG